MTQNLRQVHALVLRAPAPGVRLRQVHALALSGPGSLGIPAGKKASDALKIAILATASTAGKVVTAADFTMEDPVAITGVKNTSVKISTANIDLVSGSQTLRYNRKSLSSAGYLFTAAIEVGAVATSVLAVLAQINALTGVVFEARDFEDTVIPAGATQVTLKAVSTSYIFIPGSTLVIQTHPTYPSLSDVITQIHLSGFTPAS